MKQLLPFIIYFSVYLSLSAQKVAKEVVTQSELYIYGSIFLAISIGSLLLIINLFPKNSAYYAQQAKLKKLDDELKKTKASQNNMPAWRAALPFGLGKIGYKAPAPSKPANSQLESRQPTKSSVTQNTASVGQNTASTEASKNTQQAPKETKPTVESVPVPPKPKDIQSPVECRITNYHQVFESKSAELDTMCRDFLNKLGIIVNCKSISLYFVKNEKFTYFMERKGGQILKYETGSEKTDISDEIIKFLKNKLGAFSSTHSDAVLPMINNDHLFGAVKFQFAQALSNLDVNPIWSEVKSFARYFDQSLNYNISVQDKESSIYTMEHFNNILNYRVTMDIQQNLTLVKVIQSSDKNLALVHLVDSLKEILGKKPEVYKLNEDTLGLFVNFEDRDKISKSVNEIINSLRRKVKIADINIGSVDYNANLKFPQRWYEKAQLTLKDSISLGPNQFKLSSD